MSFGSRLKEARLSLNLTQQQVADEMGITKTTYCGYENGRRAPDVEKIKQLASILKVSGDDLLETNFRESSYLSPSDKEIIKKYRTLDEHGTQVVDSVLNIEYERCNAKSMAGRLHNTVRVIPYSNIPASAGFGEWLGAENMDEIEIPDEPAYKNADFAVPVSGDSMEPTYHDGDILLIHEQDAVNIGDTGLFSVNGDGYVKEMGVQTLISHNRDYDDIPINESFKCFGKVIGKLEK